MLVDKALDTVVISDCNTSEYPTKVTPLGTDANGYHCKERWNYTSVIRVHMYLSLNAHSEITF